ncbi:MAG: LLM class flavin-dependent oxidoreductase, partial [Frankia sp.]
AGAGAGAGAGALRRAVAAVEEAGIDQLTVGDHLTFRGGQGADGLVLAGAVAALAERTEVATSVYQLGLRHPLVAARQIVDVAALAAGGFVLGVGIGDEGRSEAEACGVDPAGRGRRLDESLAIVRRLVSGQTVDHDGEFFQLRHVAVGPPPVRPVPILVGGRSDAAVRRAGLLGDGWLGRWVSAKRFARVVAQVEVTAWEAGRLGGSNASAPNVSAPNVGGVAASGGSNGVAWRHGMQIWCGFGPTRERAVAGLAAEMENRYGLPFDRFAQWCPVGRPSDIADALLPFVGAGAAEINVVAVAADPFEAIEGVAQVRRLLRSATEITGDLSVVAVGP